jgi:transcriptional regulator with XRE-family HTH domain
MRFLTMRTRRKALRLTVLEMASRVGVSPVTVRMWERGLATPTPAHRAALEHVLGRKWVALAREAADA